ncbi:unnamed protein product [Euphydryas editha]|uniref:Uncharacterized protein n=1 Tax=Euphydryas editha TaxID=104508 RepID=A0AAU9TS87_EUPED|nr:unnamed protein product [Euphydryas editha]
MLKKYDLEMLIRASIRISKSNKKKDEIVQLSTLSCCFDFVGKRVEAVAGRYVARSLVVLTLVLAMLLFKPMPLFVLDDVLYSL